MNRAKNDQKISVSTKLKMKRQVLFALFVIVFLDVFSIAKGDLG